MKRARKSSLQERIIQGALATLATIIVSGLAYGSWNFVQAIPSKDDVKEVSDSVQLVAAKADYVLTQQMQSLIAQIARLEAKENKSKDERDQLKYLREELERMRNVQKGK